MIRLCVIGRAAGHPVLVLLLLALMWILAACASTMTRELTVDVDQIAEDPIFDVEPEGGAVIEPFGPREDASAIGVTYSDQGLSVNRRWRNVGYEAMLDYLEEVSTLGVLFSSALCAPDSATGEDVYRLQGYKLSGVYGTTTTVYLRSEELSFSLGTLLDAEPVDIVDQVIDPSDLGPLESRTCSDKQLEELERYVR